MMRDAGPTLQLASNVLAATQKMSKSLGPEFSNIKQAFVGNFTKSPSAIISAINACDNALLLIRTEMLQAFDEYQAALHLQLAMDVSRHQ